jgi:plastocyanin
MRALPLLFLFLLLVIPAAGPAQPAARTVNVQLSSFEFTPSELRLQAGQPVVLHLVNTGRGGHNFAAPQFFAAATGVSGPVRNGAVEVRGHQSVDVRLVPARGHYRLRCTHTLHSTLGMRGEIVVE